MRAFFYQDDNGPMVRFCAPMQIDAALLAMGALLNHGRTDREPGEDHYIQVYETDAADYRDLVDRNPEAQPLPYDTQMFKTMAEASRYMGYKKNNAVAQARSIQGATRENKKLWKLCGVTFGPYRND